MTNHTGNILLNPFVTNVILPFVLVFVVIFAILQKSKIFGEGKRQIDALVALVMGLIVVSFGFATGIIVSLVPFLAVSVVIILVFMILYGMAYKEGEFEMPKGLKIAVGILAGISLIIAVLVATGGWNYVIGLLGFLSGTETGANVLANVIFIVVVIAAVVAVIWSAGKNKGKDKSS